MAMKTCFCCQFRFEEEKDLLVYEVPGVQGPLKRLVCKLCYSAPQANFLMLGGVTASDAHCWLILRCMFYCTNLILKRFEDLPGGATR